MRNSAHILEEGVVVDYTSAPIVELTHRSLKALNTFHKHVDHESNANNTVSAPLSHADNKTIMRRSQQTLSDNEMVKHEFSVSENTIDGRSKAESPSKHARTQSIQDQ